MLTRLDLHFDQKELSPYFLQEIMKNNNKKKAEMGKEMFFEG